MLIFSEIEGFRVRPSNLEFFLNFFIFRVVVGDQNCPIRAILLVKVSVLYLKKTLSNDLQSDFWPLIHVKSFQTSKLHDIRSIYQFVVTSEYVNVV